MDDNLTTEQVDAITYAYMDVVAANRVFGGDLRSLDIDELREAIRAASAG